ncbi:hypothetical protein VTH8203_01371 [Vibrio thalassae]|uniref:Uncharacterized protein n=1 Tax=Vibrio thalassae TaxID=1243014 RepID=A0A240EGS4_9VIBR|nr:hypothetical protein VTH8203_01371 [Vibrio thalassae]
MLITGLKTLIIDIIKDAAYYDANSLVTVLAPYPNLCQHFVMYVFKRQKVAYIDFMFFWLKPM